MLSFFKKKAAKAEDSASKHNMKAFLTGKVIPIEEVNDGVFSAKIMGDGIAIIPENEVLTAPADGEITVVMDGSFHAVGMRLDNGVEILLHIGIDTVNLEGKGFTCFVENGQSVKKGDKMLEIDIEYLTANAPSLCSPILCTELEDNQKVRLLAEGEVKAGEPLFAVDVYEEA